jgi:hypothetical protein
VVVLVVAEVVLIMDKCDDIGACSVDDDLRCNLNFSLAMDLGALIFMVGVAIMDLLVLVLAVGARGILWLEDKLVDVLLGVIETCGSAGDETVECTSGSG